MSLVRLLFTVSHQKEGYRHPHISLAFVRRLIHCVGGEVWTRRDPVYSCIYVISACSLAIRSCRVRLLHHWVELFHSCPILLLNSPISKGSFECIAEGTSTLVTRMLKGNKLQRGRWKPNTFLEKWSWAGVTTEPEAQRGRPEREPSRQAQGVYRYFLSYNWKPWNAPWFVFFYKDWWALCFVWFGLLVCIYITYKKKNKIENTIKIFL